MRRWDSRESEHDKVLDRGQVGLVRRVPRLWLLWLVSLIEFIWRPNLLVSHSLVVDVLEECVDPHVVVDPRLVPHVLRWDDVGLGPARVQS